MRIRSRRLMSFVTCLGVVAALTAGAPVSAFADDCETELATPSSSEVVDALDSAVDLTGDQAKADGWKFEKMPFDSTPSYIQILNYEGDEAIPVVPNTIDGLPVTNVYIYAEMFSDTAYETIDVSHCASLENLNCVLLGLDRLDLGNNPHLQVLNCAQNNIAQLDLSNNVELRELDCNDNLLTSLDISSNAQLTRLVCNGNSIADVSALNAWAQKEGVTARIEPQNVPEYVPDPRLTEYSGADRYEVAHYAFAHALDGDARKGAIVVSGDDGKFSDALTASALSGLLDYPVVLTSGTWLNWDARECLKWLDNSYPKTLDIIVVGGPDTVQQSVLDEMKHYGEVSRISGANRYELAENVYRYGESHGGWGSDEVIVTKGNDFPDALCIAPYASSFAAPILLVDQNSTRLDSSVKDALANHSQAVVLGGEESVSPLLYKDIEASTRSGAIRLNGEDRYEACLSIVEWELSQGMQLEGAGFATGEKFADALSSSVLLSRTDSVLLLVNGSNDSANASTYDFLERNAEGVLEARIFGGPASVIQVVRDSIVEALGW